MTPSEIMSLLSFLDDMFQLGGKLIMAALTRSPKLNTEQLPMLDTMDQARDEALVRIEK